jgi:hypothetical protein
MKIKTYFPLSKFVDSLNSICGPQVKSPWLREPVKIYFVKHQMKYKILHHPFNWVIRKTKRISNIFSKTMMGH